MIKLIIIACSVLFAFGLCQQFDQTTHEERVATFQTRMQDMQARMDTLTQIYDNLPYKYDITFQTDSLGNVTSFVFGEDVPENVRQFYNDNIEKFNSDFYAQKVELYRQDYEAARQADLSRNEYPLNRLPDNGN